MSFNKEKVYFIIILFMMLIGICKLYLRREKTDNLTIWDTPTDQSRPSVSNVKSADVRLATTLSRGRHWLTSQNPFVTD